MKLKDATAFFEIEIENYQSIFSEEGKPQNKTYYKFNVSHVVSGTKKKKPLQIKQLLTTAELNDGFSSREEALIAAWAWIEKYLEKSWESVTKPINL